MPSNSTTYMRAYRRAHRETIRVYNALWEATHPRKRVRKQTEQQKAYDHAYAVAHRDERNAYHRMYRQLHPEKQQLWGQVAYSRRRALKQGGLSTVTGGHIRAIKHAYKGRCAYCGQKPQSLAIDHVIPLAEGGQNTVDNVVPCCTSCNSRKGTGAPPLLPAIRLLM